MQAVCSSALHAYQIRTSDCSRWSPYGNISYLHAALGGSSHKKKMAHQPHKDHNNHVNEALCLQRCKSPLSWLCLGIIAPQTFIGPSLSITELGTLPCRSLQGTIAQAWPGLRRYMVLDVNKQQSRSCQMKVSIYLWSGRMGQVRSGDGDKKRYVHFPIDMSERRCCSRI